MKRITKEQAEQAVKLWVDEDYSTRSIQLDRGHWEYIVPVIADLQLQADLQSVDKCHNEIQDMLAYWQYTIRNGSNATNAVELTDLIIKLLKGEEE